MNRREFLCAAGVAGSLGVFGAGESRDDPSTTIRIWLSRAAASYDELPSLAAGYLRRATEAAGGDVDVSVAGLPIDLDSEDGGNLMRAEWPKMVLRGTLGRGPVQPTGDVNLLVTDGSPWSRPAGYAMRGIGTVTGARWLARMPPPGRGPTTVAPTIAGTVTQLLLHECGHALGLTHEDGSVEFDGTNVVASPMVGAYAWSDAETGNRWFHPGSGGPDAMKANAGPIQRRLGLEYCDDASGALRRYRGGPLP